MLHKAFDPKLALIKLWVTCLFVEVHLYDVKHRDWLLNVLTRVFPFISSSSSFFFFFFGLGCGGGVVSVWQRLLGEKKTNIF